MTKFKVNSFEHLNIGNLDLFGIWILGFEIQGVKILQKLNYRIELMGELWIMM